ncbi:MAG: ABC transporter permease [Spirochaetes bacterium]|nr:ABC transporter permease [Spirochaetota bacterium]
MSNTAPVRSPDTRPNRGFIGSLRRTRSMSTFIIAAVLFALFSIFSPGKYFATYDNLMIFLSTEAEFAVIALAVGVLMIAGEFDLSVGSVLAFCSLTFIKLLGAGVNPVLALLLAILVGMLVGLFHGIITVKAQIPSFITTLGGLMLWRGITLFWSGGLQQGLELEKYPGLYAVIGGAKVGFVPIPFVWLLGITVVAIFFMSYHKVGNWVYVTGDNKLAAKAMGINTDRIKIACFILVGAAVGFVGVMQMFRSGTFTARAGEALELNVVAAAVVGGTALTGGIGSVPGIFWGAIVISLIENGLVMMRIPYWWTFSVFGGIIIFSVIIAKIIEARRVAAA